ncbi:MAG: AMP-binding protein, partial [Rhodobacteraceae bacterium]|nr:AMP-binding protein [Paracoccaceae bacterium]
MPDNSEALDFWAPVIRHETRDDGSILVWQEEELGPYPRCMTEKFLHWAEQAPERSWIVERGPDGAWQHMSYGEAAGKIRAIGSALLARGLSPERPLLILSGNSVRHAIMALAAQHVGVPSAALAPAYALAKGDLGKLIDVAGQLTPGMIFAEDATPFARAITEVFAADIPVVGVSGSLPDRDLLRFDDLAATAPTDEMQAAHEAIGPDT